MSDEKMREETENMIDDELLGMVGGGVGRENWKSKKTSDSSERKAENLVYRPAQGRVATSDLVYREKKTGDFPDDNAGSSRRIKLC